MLDTFFASTRKKRKRPSQPGSTSRKTPRTKQFVKSGTTKKSGLQQDEELESDAMHTDIDDLDLRASEVDPAESDREEDVRETPAAKRLRLARIYLDSVKEGLTRSEGEFDAAEIDRDIISARLKEDVLENTGKLHIFIAEKILLDGPCVRIKGHKTAVTSAILSHEATRLYMAGKEGGVSCCDVASGTRLSYAPKLRSLRSTPSGKRKGKGDDNGEGRALVDDLTGHCDEVLALALSGDGKYLVSGGKDRRIGVWSVGNERDLPVGLTWIKGFGGHKDTISNLSFRKSTNMLYSASSDRTIKLFDLSPGVMGYVETLFGHQDSVTGLDSLKGDTAVSCGGRDRTVRFWKIADETQLVFRGGGAGKSKTRDILEGALSEDEDREIDKSRKNKGKEKWVEGSVDCVAMVDEQTFLSGGDSGSIALWSTNKKKPIFTYTTAHGIEEIDSSTEGKLRRPRWVLSIACLRYSDLFASGSWDGRIRLWKLDPSLRFFTPIGSLDSPGAINSLQLVPMPKGWTGDERWSHPQKPTTNGSSAEDVSMTNGDASHAPPQKSRGGEGAILVAAVGQEPKLGRWIRLRGEGVVNSALIFSLRKRKTKA
ncbi:WD40 repeat-like protein [Ramaria rubella]|nr:WD40 repeat-like protein [Ramaria rubella]